MVEQPTYWDEEAEVLDILKTIFSLHKRLEEVAENQHGLIYKAEKWLLYHDHIPPEEYWESSSARC